MATRLTLEAWIKDVGRATLRDLYVCLYETPEEQAELSFDDWVKSKFAMVRKASPKADMSWMDSRGADTDHPLGKFLIELQ